MATPGVKVPSRTWSGQDTMRFKPCVEVRTGAADNHPSMSTKRLIWIGSIVGSFIGGLIPGLWHASMFSMWGLVLSTIGGIAGIWLGWRIGQGG